MKKNSKILIIVAVLFCLILVSLSLIFKRQAGADIVAAPTVSATATATDTGILAETLSWPSGRTIDVPILMYHHIGPLPANADDIRRGLTAATEDFEAQMKYLKDGGYNILTLKKMYELVSESRLPAKPVVLTFDDGYDDNYSYALPILQKYGLSGTFFIISGKIGQSEYMNEAQIRELLTAGNEIGSHSVTHPDLANSSDAKMKTEVEKSKADLEKIIGQSASRQIISFCYPAGKFSSEVEKLLESAGYKIAVTTQKWQPFSTDKPFEIPRLRVNPGANLKNLLK